MDRPNGQLKHCSVPRDKMTWSNSFTLSGIDFNTDLKQIIQNNYESKVQIIKNTLNSYQKRHMFILGKVRVLNTSIIPKLVYLMKVLPSPNTVFLWKWRDALKILSGRKKCQKLLFPS